MFQLTPTKWINLSKICLVLDRGYDRALHRVRIYTHDGRHEYSLTNEQYTKFMREVERL